MGTRQKPPGLPMRCLPPPQKKKHLNLHHLARLKGEQGSTHSFRSGRPCSRRRRRTAPSRRCSSRRCCCSCRCERSRGPSDLRRRLKHRREPTLNGTRATRSASPVSEGVGTALPAPRGVISIGYSCCLGQKDKRGCRSSENSAGR